MTTLDFTISEVPLSHTLSSSMFGAEYLGWTGFPGWKTQAEAIGISHIRWPAGIIAEDRIETRGYAYDITQPNIIDNWETWNGAPRTSLSELFSYSISLEASFSMIIPTGRYVEAMLNEPEIAKSTIQSDIKIFTDRLFGEYWGQTPEKFTLEVGAEYYSTDAWQENNENPLVVNAFADVFAEIVSALSDAEVRNGTEIYDIAVQSGRFQSHDDTLEVRDGEEADSDIFLAAFENRGVTGEIDTLIWHRYVYTFNQIRHYLDLDGAGAETTMAEHLSYWEMLIGHPIDFLVSWASPDIDSTGASETFPWFDYGPRSAVNTLQMFSYLAAAGADTATLYGLDSPWIGAISTGGTVPEDYSISYNGEVYRMMSESIPGLRALAGFEQNRVFVDDQNKVIEVNHVNINNFSDLEARTVSFLSAWDLESEDVSVALDFPNSHVSSFIKVSHLTPDGYNFNSGGSQKISDITFSGNGVLISGIGDFDTVRVEFFSFDLDAPTNMSSILSSETGRVWHTLDEDSDFFEIRDTHQETLTDGGFGDDMLLGSHSSDVIIGGVGSDIIFGNDGGDLLLGDSLSSSEIQDWLTGISDLTDIA